MAVRSADRLEIVTLKAGFLREQLLILKKTKIRASQLFLILASSSYKCLLRLKMVLAKCSRLINFSINQCLLNVQQRFHSPSRPLSTSSSFFYSSRAVFTNFFSRKYSFPTALKSEETYPVFDLVLEVVGLCLLGWAVEVDFCLLSIRVMISILLTSFLRLLKSCSYGWMVRLTSLGMDLSLRMKEQQPLRLLESILRYIVVNINRIVMLRSLRTLSFKVSHQPLKWRLYRDTVQLLVFDPQTQGTIIYLIDDEVTFPELKQRQLFKSYSFTLPKTVDEATPVATILTQEKPVDIQVDFHDYQHHLSNITGQLQQKIIIKTLTSPNSIYHLNMSQYTMNYYRRTINTLYLRLQAEAYLRQKGIDHKVKLTESLKDELFDYLGIVNQIPEQSDIVRFNGARDKIALKIAITQQKINQMLKEADRLLGLYRLGVIALTSIHFASFGYMIFGVEWLGWDIVEPLTFSVGSFYTLLGLRFYRRFQKDRTQQNIREALQNWVLKPSSRIQLTNLKAKLRQEQEELNEVELRIKLAHNRLVNMSTLPLDM